MTDREEIIRKARAALSYTDAERAAKEILEADRLIKESGRRVPVELSCVFYPCGSRMGRPEACNGCVNRNTLHWELFVAGARKILEEENERRSV